MILNGAAIRAAATGYRALYKVGVDQTSPVFAPFCEDAPSTGDRTTYHIPGSLPQLREWVGDRQVQNLRRYEETLKNKDWELTLGIPRNAFEDDQLGVFNSQVRMMGVQAALHPDKLFADLLLNGFDDLCYDGKAFFATDHTVDVGDAQSNKGTAALSATSFEDGIEAMRSLKNNQGEPVDVLSMGGEIHLVVPPQLEATARSILLAQFGSSGASNTNFGRAKLTVFARLSSSATKWFLLIGGGPMRPFINQVRKRPEFVARDDAADESMWNKKEVQYGVDGRWVQGYGMWQFAYGSTGAA